MPQPRSQSAKPARDTSIATYRAKRDFSKTAEPAPNTTPAGGKALIFVVQKHAASRLHYDFRLEQDGVLWSWAIPKGPSLDPKDKRLAVHVEDHPREYASFSGTIPKGEYGAGTVEVWDHGEWEPLGDAKADLARGEMKFCLRGERLHGRFVLIRLKPRPKEHAENWLLIKEHDEYERQGVDAAAMEQAAAAPQTAPEIIPDAPKPVAPKPRRRTAKPSAPAPAPAAGAIAAPMPDTQAPQLASLAVDPPATSEWLCEIKFDGYRMLVFKSPGGVRLMTRNGLDWTHRLQPVADRVAAAGNRAMLLDCELVALRPDGISSFSDLQAALSAGRTGELVLFAFDLLHLDGWDLRPCRLDDRKALLAGLDIWTDRLRYSDHHTGDAGPARKQACTMGLEGIITKRADAPYRAGRGSTWLKLKCQGREEFVVLGWTPPAGSRTGLGALQLGFYAADGALHYAGGVGTGFSDTELQAWRQRLDPLAANGPPDGLLASAEKPDSKIRWVRPECVVEVQFVGWSGAGRLRHAVYLGLREDKAAAEVVRDVPDPAVPRAAVRSARVTGIVSARKPAARATSPTPATAPIAKPAAPAIKITHPDKPLWPGITKQDLADYWQAVADWAMPSVAGRPLALVRCPAASRASTSSRSMR